MRHGRGAADERQAEGRHGDHVVIEPSRPQQTQAPGVRLDGGLRQAVQVEPEVEQHPQGQDRAAAHQQDGLDDLHPGGGRHAAEDDIDHHQRSDDHHSLAVAQPEQALH